MIFSEIFSEMDATIAVVEVIIRNAEREHTWDLIVEKMMSITTMQGQKKQTVGDVM